MRALIAAGLLVLLAAKVEARVLDLRVVEERPFAGGTAFGDAGPYLQVRAVARGELDPADPANAGISLLNLGPRNGNGRVEYEADVLILRPADPSRANGVLLYDVAVAGRMAAVPALEDGDAGFALGRGYTIVSSGWDPAVSGDGALGIRVPVVRWAGLPIVQRIRFEFQAGTRRPGDALRIALPYPVANIEHTTLTVRAREGDAPTTIPIEDWRFVDTHAIQLAPYPTGFKPLHIYDLYYEATQPTVNGMGFAAVRGVVSHLRQAAGMRHAMAVGAWAGGRFLRSFLELGMNRDEAGTRVFDGMLIHAAGAGKVFANEAFAQPFRSATQHEDHRYPEAWEPVRYAGLLHGRGTDPLVIHTDTSTEYWQKAASAVHGDAPLPEGVRMYLLAGTQHDWRSADGVSAGACASGRNPASAAPALRAMVVALEDWVVRGATPPPSEVPRRVDGTGVEAQSLPMPRVPGVSWATRDNKMGRDRVDWVDAPPERIRTYASFVPAVDADGNEVAGIRLPHVAVPLGTYAGVNVYRDLPGELCDRDGIYAPFARTRAERERTGDKRPSLQERYGTREVYVARVRAAAEALVARRLLLRGDAERYVEAAREQEF